MNWQDLLNPEIQKFIQAHKDSDVQKLALQKSPNKDWPYALIMDQIKARQKLSAKVPLQDKENLIFPPSNLVEQASSWACASYKASLVQGDIFVDLTAGSGTDSFAFSQNFKKGVAVEKDETSAGILAHNIKILGMETLEVINQSAEEYIPTMPSVDLVYIDPQRRNEQRRGIYDLTECSPDILSLMTSIKAKRIMIKTSPVLDIKKTIENLRQVEQVHIVEYNGDCKELLFILSDLTQPLPYNPYISAVIIDGEGKTIHQLRFDYEQEFNTACDFGMPETYLYEPGPAFQKSGAYKILAKTFDLKKLHPNTHLYTGDKPIKDFPGRGFKIIESINANHKSLKSAMPDMKANLTVRNFPMSVNDLRKKLKLKDGGNITLFACTDAKEQKILLKCEKI